MRMYVSLSNIYIYIMSCYLSLSLYIYIHTHVHTYIYIYIYVRSTTPESISSRILLHFQSRSTAAVIRCANRDQDFTPHLLAMTDVSENSNSRTGHITLSLLFSANRSLHATIISAKHTKRFEGVFNQTTTTDHDVVRSRDA